MADAAREPGKVIRKKRELAYEGTILKVYRDFVEANGREAVWDYIHHDGAAAVVPVLPDGRILMVRQYRNALDRFTLELPAGKVDSPDEPRVLCAFRELAEETGMQAKSPEALEFLIRIDTTVAFCDEEIDIFVARELLPGEQHLDPDEEIVVQAYELSDLIARIYRGEIRDGKTVAGLTAYALQQNR